MQLRNRGLSLLSVLVSLLFGNTVFILVLRDKGICVQFTQIIEKNYVYLYMLQHVEPRYKALENVCKGYAGILLLLICLKLLKLKVFPKNLPSKAMQYF